MAIPVPRVTITNAGSGNNQHPVHRVSIDLDPTSAEQNTNGYELRYFYEVYDSVAAYDTHYANSRAYTQPIDMFLNSNCVVVVHAAYYVIGENTHGAFGVGQCVSTIVGRSHTWHWHETPGDTGDGFHRWITDGTNTVRPVEYPVYDAVLDALALRRGSWVSYDLARVFSETVSKPELSQALSGGYTLRFRINTANAPVDFGDINNNASFMFCFGEAKFEYGIPCLEISKDQVRLRVACPSINGCVVAQSIDGYNSLGDFVGDGSSSVSTGSSKNIEVLVHVAVSTTSDPEQQQIVMGVEVACPDSYAPYSGLSYAKSSVTGCYVGSRPDKFVIGCPSDPSATNTQPSTEFITLSSVALYDHQNTMIVYQHMYNNEPISKPFGLDNCEDDLPGWWVGGDTDPVVPHRNGSLSWLAAGNKNTMFLYDNGNTFSTMPDESPFTMALDFSQVTTGQVEIRFPYSTPENPGGYDSYPTIVYDAESKTITLHAMNRIGNSAAGDIGAWRGTKFHSTVLQIHAAPASTYGTNGYKRIVAMVGDCATVFASRVDSGNAKLYAIGVTEYNSWVQFTQPFFISNYANPERAGFNICSRNATGQVLLSQLSRGNFVTNIDTEINAGPIFDAKRCETPKFKLTNASDNTVKLDAWCDITGTNNGNYAAKYGCRIRYTVDGTEPISSHTTLEMPLQGVVLSEAANVKLIANESSYNLMLHRSSAVVGTQVLGEVPDLVDPGMECYTNIPVTVAFAGSDAGSTLLVDNDAFDTVPETDTDAATYSGPLLVTRTENEKATTRRGFALGSNNHVYVWSDAGKWKRLTRASIPDAVDLDVSPFHEAYVVTSTGKLYRSVDLVNYREITGPAVAEYAGVACRGSIVCVLPAGTATVFHVSFDSGATWETRDLPESGIYTVLEFADDLVFVGTPSKLWKATFSSTAPLTYTLTASPSGSLRGIACGFDANKSANAGHRNSLVAVTSTGVYSSSDDATTWSVVDSAIGACVSFIDVEAGSYVVGIGNALSRMYSNTGYVGTVKPSTGLLASTSTWLIKDHWFELSQHPYTGTTAFNGSAMMHVPDGFVTDYVGGIWVGVRNQGIYRAINNQNLFSVDNVVCAETKNWQGLFLYNNTAYAIVNDNIGNGGGLYTVDPSTKASTLVLALDNALFACVLADKAYIGLSTGGIAEVNLTNYTYTVFGTPTVYGSGAVSGTSLVVCTQGMGVVHSFDTGSPSTAPVTLSFNQRVRTGLVFYKDRYYFACENSLWELVLSGSTWKEHLVSRVLAPTASLTVCCIGQVVRDETDTSNPGGTRIYATALNGVVYNARMISAPLPYRNVNARFSTRNGVRRKRLLFGAHRSLLPITASVFDCIRGSVAVVHNFDTNDGSPRGTCSRMVITAPTGGVRLQRDRVSARMVVEITAFNHFRLKLLGSPYEVAWRTVEGAETLGIFNGSTLVQSAGTPASPDNINPVVFKFILCEYTDYARMTLNVMHQSYASVSDVMHPMKQFGLEFTTEDLEEPTQLGFIALRHIGFAPQGDSYLDASQHRIVVPGVGTFTQAPSNVIRVPKDTVVQVLPGRVNYAPVDFDFNVLDTEIFTSTMSASEVSPAVAVYKAHAAGTNVSTHAAVTEMPTSGVVWAGYNITIDDNCVLAYLPVGPSYESYYGYGFPQELYAFVVDETIQAGPQLVTFARYAQHQHGASRTPHQGMYGSRYTFPVNKWVHAGKQNQEYNADSNNVFESPDSAGGSRGVSVFAAVDYAQDSMVYVGSEFDNENAAVIEFGFEKISRVGSFVLGCGFGTPDKEFLCLYVPRINGHQPRTSEFAQAGSWDPTTNTFVENTTVVGTATSGNGLFPEARRIRLGRKIVGGVQYTRLVYLITSRYRQSIDNVPEMYVQYDSGWVVTPTQTGRRPFITMLNKHSNHSRCPMQIGFPTHYGWFNLNATTVDNVLIHGLRVQPPALSVTPDVDLDTVTLNQQVTLTITPPEGMTGTYYAKVHLDGDDQIIPLQATTDTSPSPPSNGNSRYYVGALSEAGSTITLTAPFRIAVCAVYDQQLLGGRAVHSPATVVEAKVLTSSVVSVASAIAGEVTLQIDLPEQDAGTLCFEFDDLKIEEFAYSSYIYYNRIKRKMSPGQHTVRLVRWGSSNPNASNSWWKSASLEPMEFTVPDKLDANLTITPATVAQTSSVAFTSEVIGGTAPFTYLYRFGDGSESTQANPTHQYTAPGVYDVSLEIRDVNGDSTIIKRHGAVTVLQAPLTDDPLSLLKTTRIS